ncbi:MAG: response regulator transcription factor [Dermatophilaceae bacterium]
MDPKEPAVRVLLVEDEDPMREMLTAALRHEGFEVAATGSGREAVDLARTDRQDVVVLDVNLPDIDGFTVCRRLRQSGADLPVLFLTARDARADLRTGFGEGADDYLTKPFSLEELALRLRALTRRGRVPGSPASWRCGDLVVDDTTHRVSRGGAPIELSPTQYRLLRHLLVHVGQVLSKEQLLREVWRHGGVDPAAEPGATNLVEAHISQLRRRVDSGGQPPLLHTVRGFGYVIRPPEG